MPAALASAVARFSELTGSQIKVLGLHARHVPQTKPHVLLKLDGEEIERGICPLY